jgi:hypothetical protein
MPGMCECVCCGEAADSRADDEDIEAEGCAAVVIEGRDLLKGNVCGCLCECVWMIIHDGNAGMQEGKAEAYGRQYALAFFMAAPFGERL